MKSMILLAAAAALALAGPAVAQDKKQLAIVVKGLDNAFFESIHQGCEKWNGENAATFATLSSLSGSARLRVTWSIARLTRAT